MVNDAFYSNSMMRFCFVFLFFNDVLYFNDAFYLESFIILSFHPPIPIISNHFYPFLSNSKISFTFQNI